MDFAESEEHRALRAAVAEIAKDFGPRYYAERAAERRPCAELWSALGKAGFIGVNIPQGYGGGRGGAHANGRAVGGKGAPPARRRWCVLSPPTSRQRVARVWPATSAARRSCRC